jgi:hypothetical protein
MPSRIAPPRRIENLLTGDRVDLPNTPLDGSDHVKSVPFAEAM